MESFFDSSIQISDGVLPTKKVYLDSNAAGLVNMSDNSTSKMWNFRPISGGALLYNIIKNSGQGQGKFINCTSDGRVLLAGENGSPQEQWQLTEHAKFYTIENKKGTDSGLTFLGCKPDGDVAMFKDGEGDNTKWMIEALNA